MAPRRRAGTASYDPQRAAQEVKEAVAHLTGRLEQIAENWDGRFARLERDSAMRERGEGALTSELAAVRIDAGELRDAVAKLERKVNDFCAEQPTQIVAGAAQGAAAGAAQAVVVATEKVTAQAVAKGFMATAVGKVVVYGGGFTTLMVALNNVPDLLRGIERVYMFIRGAP